MLTVKSCPVELRGIANKATKDGKPYYILNVEDNEGNPHGLYCRDFNKLPQGMKKGDMIQVTFEVHYFGGKERLIVSGITPQVV